MRKRRSSLKQLECAIRSPGCQKESKRPTCAPCSRHSPTCRPQSPLLGGVGVRVIGEGLVRSQVLRRSTGRALSERRSTGKVDRETQRGRPVDRPPGGGVGFMEVCLKQSGFDGPTVQGCSTRRNGELTQTRPSLGLEEDAGSRTEPPGSTKHARDSDSLFGQTRHTDERVVKNAWDVLQACFRHRLA